MGLDELLRSLMTHEIIMMSNDESDESKKQKGIAFKASSSKIEEDMAIFTRRFNKIFKRG